jgi:adenylate kinase family enzyme
MLVSVLVIGVLTGCMGAPSWVKQGSGVRKARWNVGIYGVGEGAPEVAPAVQSDLASLNAETAVAQTEQGYVADLFKDFVEAHPKWFKTQQVAGMNLYEKTAQDVANDTLYLMEMTEQWVDKGGAEGERGTVYVLRRIPLDKQFFKVVHENLKSVIQQNKDKILRVEVDEVLEGLEKHLMARAEDPLGAAMMAEKKTEEAAKPAEKEAAQKAGEAKPKAKKSK